MGSNSHELTNLIAYIMSKGDVTNNCTIIQLCDWFTEHTISQSCDLFTDRTFLNCVIDWY